MKKYQMQAIYSKDNMKVVVPITFTTITNTSRYKNQISAEDAAEKIASSVLKVFFNKNIKGFQYYPKQSNFKFTVDKPNCQYFDNGKEVSEKDLVKKIKDVFKKYVRTHYFVVFDYTKHTFKEIC